MSATSMLLKLTFEKFLAETPARFKELREESSRSLERVQKEIAELNKAQLAASSSSSQPVKPVNILIGDSYWLPFKMALTNTTYTPKIREVALDSLQKLMAHSIVVGREKLPNQESSSQLAAASPPDVSSSSKTTSIAKHVFLIDEIIDTVCSCYTGPDTDEAVQLQILKLLLTAATTKDCEVHGIFLIKSVQTCFAIYLQSKSPINQATAKAALTQICHLPFQKLDMFRISFPEETAGNAAGDGAKKDSAEPQVQRDIDAVSVNSDVVLAEVDVADDGDEIPQNASSFETSKGIYDCFTAPPGKYGYCLVCYKPAEHFCATTKDPICSVECKQQNLKKIGKEKAEPQAQPPPAPPSSELTVDGLTPAENDKLQKFHSDSVRIYAAILKRDCRFLFRFLCRASVKFDGDENMTIAIRGRVVSLELLLSTLNNFNNLFKDDVQFMMLIRKNLCLAVSKNGVNSNMQIFELALSIFVYLLSHFFSSLKNELEVLFSSVYLELLDMFNATYQQRIMVLQSFQKLCSTAQMLLDIYVNYDCDFAMDSVYEKLVSALSRLSQGNLARRSSLSTVADKNGTTSNGGTVATIKPIAPVFLEHNPELEKTVRVKSLKCLVDVATSLATWYREISNNENAQIFVGACRDLKSPVLSDERLNDSPVSSTGPVIITKNPLNVVLSSDISSPMPEGEDDPSKYVEAKSKKQMLRQGVSLFNSKPQSGIEFLIKEKFLNDSIEDIAAFLKATPGLSKSAIGEYIGDGGAINIRVMHAFIDLMDFTGLGFVPALRVFLQSFRLPGESQKIDRLMEKFADRYCETNSGVFATADTAYALAFATIMLNTDRHSSQVRNKMTLAQFFNITKGIGQGNENLSDTFLTGIYEDIINNEIVLEEEQMSSIAKLLTADKNRAIALDEKTKKELYRRETAQIKAKSEAQFKGNKSSASFRTATKSDHIRPMFELTWAPLLAVLSRTIETCEDSDHEVINCCLKGYIEAIRLSCFLGMEIERETFVSGLAKYTNVTTISDLKAKNIGSMKATIYVANTLGNYLNNSWYPICQCISRLEKLQLIEASQLNMNQSQEKLTTSTSKLDSLFQYFSSATTTDLSHAGLAHSAPLIKKKGGSTINLLEEIQGQSIVVAVDHIFSNSDALPGESVACLFKALCDVSREEVYSLSTSATTPRMYCLQKIVEMAYYNMGRIRLEWTQIWRILQPFFNDMGTHVDQGVCTFAVDSLRQLSMKFLDKDELSHFHAQNEFLKPFEYVMKNNTMATIRDLIVQSFAQMIMARARNIKSGWRNMFVVLSRVAVIASTANLEGNTSYQETISLLNSAFAVIQKVNSDFFEHVLQHGFVDYVSCLVEYSVNSLNEDVVKASVKMLQSCSVHIIDGKSAPIAEEEFFLKWFPILAGFSRIVVDSESANIRTMALDILFDTLTKIGNDLSPGYWKNIYRSVLMPIFEDLKDPEIKKREMVSTVVWIQALRLLVDLMSNYFSILMMESEFSTGLFELISLMVLRKNENLSQTGIICLHQFVTKNAAKFRTQHWKLVISTVCNLINGTLPVEWLEYNPKKKILTDDTSVVLSPPETSDELASQNASTAPPSPNEIIFDFRMSNLKCTVHLSLLQTLRDICNSYFVSFQFAEQRGLLEEVYKAYQFWSSFNKNYSLRQEIFKLGFVSQMENLVYLKQETLAISLYVGLLYKLYRSSVYSLDSGLQEMTYEEVKKLILTPLFTEVDRIFASYIKFISNPTFYRRELSAWSFVIERIYFETSLVIWPAEFPSPLGEEQVAKLVAFRRELPRFYNAAIRLLIVDDSQVRNALISFMEKLGSEFLFVDSPMPIQQKVELSKTADTPFEWHIEPKSEDLPQATVVVSNGSDMPVVASQ